MREEGYQCAGDPLPDVWQVHSWTLVKGNILALIERKRGSEGEDVFAFRVASQEHPPVDGVSPSLAEAQRRCRLLITAFGVVARAREGLDA